VSRKATLIEQNLFGEIYRLMRDLKYAKALKILIDPNSLSLKKHFIPYANHASYLIGQIYYEKKKYHQAANAFKNALKIDANDVLAMWGLANCYVDIGKLKEAEKILLSALDLKPRDARLKYNLANVYYDLGSFDEAVRRYKLLVRSRNTEIAEKARKNMMLSNRMLKKTATELKKFKA
jgi:tetratricopeptide (TPR) repeat protein